MGFLEGLLVTNTKMEVKSYQGNVGKALMRAGYERYGTTGRQVRWSLPKIYKKRNKHITQEPIKEENIRRGIESKVEEPIDDENKPIDEDSEVDSSNDENDVIYESQGNESEDESNDEDVNDKDDDGSIE